MVNVDGLGSAAVSFIADMQTRSASVVWADEGGGTVTAVVGEGYSEDAGPVCMFDERHVESHWVSSAVVQCESPEMPVGMRSLQVRTWDRRHSGSVALLVVPEVQLLEVSPRSGSERGGTKIALNGAGWANELSNTGCRLGSIGPVMGQILGIVMECVVPGHRPGAVDVGLQYPRLSRTQLEFVYTALSGSAVLTPVDVSAFRPVAVVVMVGARGMRPKMILDDSTALDGVAGADGTLRFTLPAHSAGYSAGI
jgi:hypothetical protein